MCFTEECRPLLRPLPFQGGVAILMAHCFEAFIFIYLVSWKGASPSSRSPHFSFASSLFSSVLAHNHKQKMVLTLDSDGCRLIRKQVYCENNITQIYYDGQPRPSSQCTLDICSLIVSNWGYLPNVPGNVFFVIIFALIFLLQIPLGVWKKTWGVLIGMTIGSALEAVGYVGRIMAHNQPFQFNPFLIYIIFLTIAPAFLSAAIYVCLTRIIVVYGQSNARFSPRIYSVVFMFSDFVALVLQGSGGGLASVNAGKDADKAQMGINIMIAGLAWQVVSLTIFAIAAADFAWCVNRKRGASNPSFVQLRKSKKFKAFLWRKFLQTTPFKPPSLTLCAQYSASKPSSSTSDHATGLLN